jgi:acyl-coenzyme A thioesterase PaaI-like protein
MAQTRLAALFLAVYQELQRIAAMPHDEARSAIEAFEAEAKELGGAHGPLVAGVLDPVLAAMACAATPSERAAYLAATLNMQEGAKPME